MFKVVQPERFKKITKNNGLKDIEWGSDEFIEAIKKEEQRIERDIEMAKYMPDSIVFLE